MLALRDPAVYEKQVSYLDISTAISSTQDLQKSLLSLHLLIPQRPQA